MRAAAILAIVAATVWPQAAAADSVLIAAGAGASTDGWIGRGELGGRLGRASGAIRFDTTERVTALVGVGPRVTRRREIATRWGADCMARLRAEGPGSSDTRCWAERVQRVAVTRADHGWLGVVAGARRDGRRTEAITAIQIHPTTDVLGDVLELGVSAVVAGRDRLFVHHARFAPGWYARAQLRIWHVIIGGEVGASGLASRTETGAFRAEIDASATLGVGVVL